MLYLNLSGHSMFFKKRFGCHVVWCLINIFSVQKTDHLLAQVEIGGEVLNDFLEKTSATIPERLKTFTVTRERNFCPQLRSHVKFNDEQDWFLSKKSSGRAARCSGCLKPGAIKVGDLHLSVKGLFYLEKDNRVVETK